METAILRRDQASLQANRQAAITLAGQLRRNGFPPEQGEQVGGGRLLRRVPVQFVDAFLLAFRNHEGSPLTETGPVRKYIRQRQADELAEWDILFAGITSAKAPAKPLEDSSLGFRLICQRRAEGRRIDDATLMISKKQRVSTRGIARIGVDDEDAHKAEADYDANTLHAEEASELIRTGFTAPFASGHCSWSTCSRSEQKTTICADSEPVVAWSISFPKTSREEEKVEYVVNTTWEHEHYPEDDDEEDAGDGE